MCRPIPMTRRIDNVQIKQESPAQSRVGFVMLTRSLHFSHCRHRITNTCHLLFSISICHHSIFGRLSVVPKNSSVITISLVQFRKARDILYAFDFAVGLCNETSEVFSNGIRKASASKVT